jgi:tRNA A37 N6-isopentenylltransferase MiaA
VSLSDAIAEAKSDTRKYAKRQRTWLKRNMYSWVPINTQQMEIMTDADLSFIDR